MRWHSSGACRIQKNNDDILHDGSKGGREMGATPGLQLPSLLSVCKVEMLLKSSDTQRKQ